MFVFSILSALIPLFYLVVHTPLQLYIVQFALGLFTAFTYPAFMAIFTRHIDKNKECTEWGLYFTLTDTTSAILAVVGGYIAVSSGFPILIGIVVLLSVIGALFLLPIKNYIRKK